MLPPVLNPLAAVHLSLLPSSHGTGYAMHTVWPDQFLRGNYT